MGSIDPIALQIGPIAIYWYGISYAIGILLGIQYAVSISKKFSLNITPSQLESFLVYLIIGIILGGRLGYVIIYDPMQYVEHPLEIFKIRNGGMAFHGAVVGVALLTFLFCKKHKIRFLELTDIIAIVAPIGIGFGRIGNFINGELYGRITTMPWGVSFPSDPNHLRHPSQVYESFLEGLVLFIIMYWTSKKIKETGYNTGIFLVFYHLFRIICEFFREPDIQLGFLFAKVTMGQILSIPFLILGLYYIKGSQCQSRQ